MFMKVYEAVFKILNKNTNLEALTVPSRFRKFECTNPNVENILSTFAEEYIWYKYIFGCLYPQNQKIPNIGNSQYSLHKINTLVKSWFKPTWFKPANPGFFPLLSYFLLLLSYSMN